MDRHDPNQWTKEFVLENKDFWSFPDFLFFNMQICFVYWLFYTRIHP